MSSVDVHLPDCEPCRSSVEAFLSQVTLTSHVEIDDDYLKRIKAMRWSETTLDQDGSSELDIPAAESRDDWGQIEQIGRYRVLRELGHGGFGRVFLAHDEILDRAVAVKVSRAAGAEPASLQAYVAEARSLARLDHPHIVPVYDCGQTEDGVRYVVSKYIEGRDLAEQIRAERPSLPRACALIAAVAEALDHAHERGLVHRDIKPANILIGPGGEPFVVDFGLAVRDEQVDRGTGVAGSPAYMSPEQARGEGHRVERRSDVFSLGVVLYELATGTRPFSGETLRDVLREVVAAEPSRPRQVDPGIPPELERIILKALARRINDRYATALGMAQDLRHFSYAASRQAPTLVASAAAPGEGRRVTESDTLSLAVVPKGLRSFDGHDADFFLGLIPGARDRFGLPESLRFWKTRIESRDADHAFRVGLIYGPSGCGKSSLVKAGLLPRLAGDVRPVYLEALPTDTEERLLRAIRKACPDLPAGVGLADAMGELRRGRGLPGGAKLVVVLDQFEQWLLARRGRPDSELVAALRQCDGERIQSIVMVRDDFWMAATRLFRDLEIPLVEGANTAAVDLFDPRHARLVLAAFGRAYGALPERSIQMTADQNAFLDRSIAGLAQEDKVIPVRLALFAEMVKGKAWEPRTLRDVGGAEGVGLAFLEETFGKSASPAHALHRNGARAVLRALLPESRTQIKGRGRTVGELRERAGYVGQDRSFEGLMHVLDAELRLITPIDSEEESGDPVAAESAEVSYQLSHDFLVPSISDWLTREQRSTRRGRAEIRLAERAATWEVRPKAAYLPGFLEWAEIRLWTRRSGWTAPQRQMMRKAARYHSARGLVRASLLGLLVWGGVELYGRLHAAELVEQLETAGTLDVPRIVDRLPFYRRWADSLLRSSLNRAQVGTRAELHARLALLAVDPGQVEPLRDRLLSAQPADLPILVRALAPHRDRLIPQFFDLLTRAEPGDPWLLPAAGALAKYAPSDPRWAGVGNKVARALTTLNPVALGSWLEDLRDARGQLIGPMGRIFADRSRTETEHALATEILAVYAARDPDRLIGLSLEADPKAFARFFPIIEHRASHAVDVYRRELGRTVATTRSGLGGELDRDAQAARQARAAVGLVRLGHADEVWRFLRFQADPRLRSFLINWLNPFGASPGVIVDALLNPSAPGLPQEDHPNLTGAEALVDPATSTRRGLIEALGSFAPEKLSPDERERTVASLLRSYEHDADPGIHSAAEWALRRWEQGGALQAIDARLKTPGGREGRRWFIDDLNQTFVRIEGPVTFGMGSPVDEPAWSDDFPLHQRTIGHSFVIAAKEVSIEVYRQFLRDNPDRKPPWRGENVASPSDRETPITGVSWYDAVACCNWLSRRDGIPEDQWCYAPNARGEYAEGMQIKPNCLERTGYRLPTQAEWEYACRAGTTTSRYYGYSTELLIQYAQFQDNSATHVSRSAQLLPNDLGLFDMLGNSYEWCQDPAGDNEPSPDDRRDDQPETIAARSRRLRGGSFGFHSAYNRSAFCGWSVPSDSLMFYGFRPVRTVR